MATLEAGTSVIATHPDYFSVGGNPRWWHATVTDVDADSRYDGDEGVFLEFDDGDRAYQKLDQLRLIEPLPTVEAHGDLEAREMPAPGTEVLVKVRQYTHNNRGPFYEWQRCIVCDIVCADRRRTSGMDSGKAQFSSEPADPENAGLPGT